MIFEKVPPDHPRGWEEDETGATQDYLGSRLQQILVNASRPYDQPILMERRGSVSIFFHQNDEDEKVYVVLVKQERPCITLDKCDTYDELMLKGDFDSVIRILGNQNWEIPRGLPQKVESRVETAIREGREETGINSSLITSKDLLAQLVCNSTFFAQPIDYIACRLSEKAATSLSYQDQEETISNVGWFELEEVIEMITSGSITCGITAQAVFLLKNHLR